MAVIDYRRLSRQVLRLGRARAAGLAPAVSDFL